MASDSDLSDIEIPSDVILEETLRAIVQKGELEPLTVNTVRIAAEEQLSLPSGFFKSHEEWKSKSKDIISNAVAESASQRSPSPVGSSPPKKTSKPAKPTTKKRPSTEKAQPKPSKRQKRAVSDSDVSEVESLPSDESEAEEPEPVEKKAAASKSRGEKQAVKEVEVDEDVSDATLQPTDGDQAKATAEDSESEMSVVLDEAPPKRRQKSATTDSKTKSKPKTKAPKTAKASASTSKDVSPDEAEIKRLQGWLLKCGIRKLWHRELANCDTPKAKIKHLKEMLKDAGMDGRYSEQKAKSIKEQRELAAELEAVQEGAKQWGDKDEGSDDSEPEEKPRRRVAARAAARFVDFGDEDDDDDDE